jgi:hypothetical protein
MPYLSEDLCQLVRKGFLENLADSMSHKLSRGAGHHLRVLTRFDTTPSHVLTNGLHIPPEDWERSNRLIACQPAGRDLPGPQE